MAIHKWDELSQEEQKKIMNYVSLNLTSVREYIRKKFPHLYTGMSPEEVAKGWLMIEGLDGLMDYIDKSR